MTEPAPGRCCPGLLSLGSKATCGADSGYKGDPFATAALAHDIHVSVSPGGTSDGRFIPNGMRWVVERLFAWLSRYRRLNTVFDRKLDLLAAHVWLLAAHVWIAMISLLARRLLRSQVIDLKHS